MMTPQPQAITPAQQDYSFIAFALMGVLVDADAACQIADSVMTGKGYSADAIVHARMAVKARIDQWGRP